MKLLLCLSLNLLGLVGFSQFEMPKRTFKVNALSRKNPNTTATPNLERSTNSNETIKFESSFLKTEAPWKSISNLKNINLIFVQICYKSWQVAALQMLIYG